MSNEIKDKILNLCGDNTDLKLAIVAQPDNTQDKDKKWIPNPFFRASTAVSITQALEFMRVRTS